MRYKSTILKFAARRNTKRGSYTLEAVLLLPLFIVGILTIGFTIRMVATSENITFSATDEARLISKAAYNMPVAPFFPTGLEQRVLDENKAVVAAEVSKFHYLYPNFEKDGLISFRIGFRIETGLPLGLADELDLEQRFLCRGFIGREVSGTPMSFEEMEKDADGTIVWVFPQDGEKYHCKSCPFIASYPAQMILNQQVKKDYSPCPICGSADAEDGMQVFCFQAYGKSYHLRSCPLVDKYVISMEKEQAESRGYTPCLKCGGAE